MSEVFKTHTQNLHKIVDDKLMQSKLMASLMNIPQLIAVLAVDANAAAAAADAADAAAVIVADRLYRSCWELTEKKKQIALSCK